MNYIKVLSGVLILFVMAGCEEAEPEIKQLVKQEVPRKTMTGKTEIKAAEDETVKISIPTVICKTCERNIVSALNEHDGIIETSIDIKKKTAKVVFDPVITNPENIRKVISDAGYDADNVKRNLNAYQNLDECCKLESNIHI